MHVCIWIKVMVKLLCFIAEIINSANNFNQKAYIKAKSTTQGIPRWSPTKVLTLPDTA